MLSLAILFSCSEDDLCLMGSGQISEYALELDAIDGVSLSGPINLRITQEETQNISVLAEPQMYQYLDYKVKDNILYIGYDENITCFDTDYGVWVNVTAPLIKTIYSSGVNEIISDGPIVQDHIKISSSGTANMKLSGLINEQSLSGSGVLNVKNFDLQSASTTINISGSGYMEVSCTDNLNIDVSGSAAVLYKGTPTIKKEVSGALTLNQSN